MLPITELGLASIPGTLTTVGVDNDIWQERGEVRCSKDAFATHSLYTFPYSSTFHSLWIDISDIINYFIFMFFKYFLQIN
jgi:hypothetical protein